MKTKSIRGDNNGRWAPLSYPSAAIFSSFNSCSASHGRDGSVRISNVSSSTASVRENGGKTPTPQQGNTVRSVERSPNPYFPLHRDVLQAAMRELLIMDGKIDPRTLEMFKSSDLDAAPCSNINKDEPVSKTKHCPIASSGKETKRKMSTVSSSGDEDENSNAHPLAKKQLLQVSRDEISNHDGMDASSIPFSIMKNSSNHNVVPFIAEVEEGKGCFDYSRFKSSEELVDYAVKQAITVSHSQSSLTKEDEECEDNIMNDSSAEYSSVTMEPIVTSTRKVSDADILEQTQQKHAPHFPPYIISLARSNIMLFQTTPSSATNDLPMPTSAAPKPLSNWTPNSTLTERERNIFHSKLSSPMTIAELLPKNTTNSHKTNDAIMSFLQRPQQQHREKTAHKFVLPKLLDASITDECNLRKVAHDMTVAMLNALPENNMEIPLRMFLGYKSPKAPNRDRILEMVSDILFDVSHALYAWIQTENKIMLEMKKNRNNPSHVVVPTRSGTNRNNKWENYPFHDMETKIKNMLFDDRTIKRLGGFETSSLLPLAIGIHRCHQTETSWAEFAHLPEGGKALSVHNVPRRMVACGNGRVVSSKARKERNDIAAENRALLELGKLRRGRRGRAVQNRDCGNEKENGDKQISTESRVIVG